MDLYKFDNYREYLKEKFSGKGKSRGTRSPLVEFLGCQLSFFNQVLTFRSHLSLEHAYKTSEYLGFDTDEQEYFLTLVQKDKSGSVSLENYFKNKIITIKKERELISKRVKVTTSLTIKDQMKYYSKWYFSAIHILSALPSFNYPEEISAHLKIDLMVTKKALSFLIKSGFVISTEKGLNIGATRIHLNLDSDMLPRHHSNWRIKAIEAVDNQGKNSLHYSSILGISQKDIIIIKEKILILIQEIEPIIQDSAEESPVVFLCDFFEL